MNEKRTAIGSEQLIKTLFSLFPEKERKLLRNLVGRGPIEVISDQCLEYSAVM